MFVCLVLLAPSQGNATTRRLLGNDAKKTAVAPGETLLENYGAVERTRTSTVLLPPAPQAGASASSATTAQWVVNHSNDRKETLQPPPRVFCLQFSASGGRGNYDTSSRPLRLFRRRRGRRRSRGSLLHGLRCGWCRRRSWRILCWIRCWRRL